MKRMKVLLAVLLFLAGTAFTGMQVHAEGNGSETYISGDYEYELNTDDTAVLTRYTGDAAYLTLPADLDGHELTSIDRFAFIGCDSLRIVTLPDGLEEIESNPFAGCSRLHTIKVSDGNEYLTVSDGLLYHKKDKRVICCPPDLRVRGTLEVQRRTKEIGDLAFYQCGKVTEISLPDSLVRIGNSAFKHCVNLEEVNFPKKLASIGNSAFEDCESLLAAELPDGLSTLGTETFRGCESLTYVRIPDSLEELTGNPFADCGSLSEFRVSEEHPVFTTLNRALFNKTDAVLVSYPAGLPDTDWELPAEVQAIGDYAFFNCRNIVHVLFTSEGLTEIRDSAFAGCSNLSSADFPAGLKRIGSFAYEFCERLHRITLPEGLESIGSDAFSLCGQLPEAILPEGLTYLGDDAFAFCNSLTRVSIPNSLTTIDTNPFTYCKNLREIRVSTKHPVFAVIKYALYNTEEHTLVCYPAGVNLRTYRIAKDTEKIGDFAFYNCDKLKTLELPEGITEIGENAFDYCVSLRSVKLPESLTQIGNNAFGHCGSSSLLIYEGSYADEYCEEHELNYEYR